VMRKQKVRIVIPSVARNLFCDTLGIAGLRFGPSGIRTRETQWRFLATLGMTII